MEEEFLPVVPAVVNLCSTNSVTYIFFSLPAISSVAPTWPVQGSLTTFNTASMGMLVV